MSILNDDTYAGGKNSTRKHLYMHDSSKNEKVMGTAKVKKGQSIWCPGGCHNRGGPPKNILVKI
jgi:hypothetical protein